MPLNDATARALVLQWSASATQAFPSNEIELLIAELIALSAQTTTRIVEDVPLSDAQQQDILSHRAQRYLEDWIGMAARALRRQFDTAPQWRQTASTNDLPVGLRSASKAEKIDLPVIGDSLAERIDRYLVQNPTAEMEDLLNVKGIGATGLKALKATSYLDTPTCALLSPTLLNFVRTPSIDTLIQVFESSDMRLEYGD